MLAYVFWHHPQTEVAAGRYEESVRIFHEALREHPPAGFRGCVSFSIPPTPWMPVAAYEDWYLLEDFASLGTLNEAAVSAFRKLAHDEVARLSDQGAGGVYRLVSGPLLLEHIRRTVWLRKPRGWSYPRFYETLDAKLAGAHVNLWQRQMTLGPAPEFCLHSEEPVELADVFEPLTLGVTPL